MILEQREWFEALCYIATRAGIQLATPGPKPRPEGRRRPIGGQDRAKLLACTHSLELQGAPISLLEVLIGLTRTSNYELHLVSPAPGPLAERAKRAGITIHIVPSPQDHAGGGDAYERGIENFGRLLTNLDPALVIANTVASFHAIDAARSVGIPSIWVIRESDDPASFFSLYPRAVQRRGLACAAYPCRMVFVSRDALGRWQTSTTRRRIIETAPDRTTIEAQARNWSRQEARRSLGLDEEDVMLLTVGTLCANKGQLGELAAMALLADSGHRLNLVLAGTPAEPGGNAVLNAWRKLPVAMRTQVNLLGETPDIGRVYAAADIYVCASHREGYPRTILEALAFGLPIVATHANGVREVVGDTHVEYFQAGSAESLANALRRVLASESLRRAMQQSSLQRWQSLPSHDSMIEAYLHEINSILRETGWNHARQTDLESGS